MSQRPIRRPRTLFRKTASALLAAALLWSLAACGQRGPLYLPDEEGGAKTPPKQEMEQEKEKENDGAKTGT